MVQLDIRDNNICVTLSCWEWLIGGFWCCCCSLTYPISSVTAVRVSHQMWTDLRGIRVGLGIPYVVMLGSRIYCDGKDFAYVTRNKPGVIIDFGGQPYKRWNVSIDNPEAFAKQLEEKMKEAQGFVAPHKIVE